MRSWLRRLVSPPHFEGDEERTQAAALLNTILLVVLAGSLLYAIFAPVDPTVRATRLLYVAGFVSLSLALLYATRRGKLRLSAAVLITGMWLMMSFSVLQGGMRTNAYSGFLIVVLCAGLLLGQRAAMAWAVACIAVGALSLFGGRFGWLRNQAVNFDPVATWVLVSIYILTAGLLLSLALRSLNRALQRARREIEERQRTEEALRRLHEEVQRYADELELRVAARTRELAEANNQLKALDQMKSKFISDVSHELRTPVTSLKLHVDLLERGRSEKRVYYLEVLRQQCDRLQQLIEDILNLSRVELGREKIAFGPVDLNQLVAEIVKLHHPSALAAGVELSCQLAADLPPVWGEVNQLAQVVTNLLTNALNYTPAGRVTITTWPADSEIRLSIQDTGIGIDEDDQPHLFERFYRGRRRAKSDVPGTGLGLAIVKEIVELHSGRIQVSSQIGSGSTFLLALPAAAGAQST